jgi:transposase
MQAVTTIGLDIAKSVFQVHGVDAAGQVLIRRQLKRRAVLAFFEKLPVCLVGIEACASSHYWSRELQALGHSVRLMPPAYVKHLKAEHMAAPTNAANVKKALANSEPSTHGTATAWLGPARCAVFRPEREAVLIVRDTKHGLL